VKARRRRGLLLLSVALASGGLAASEVHERERSLAARVGPEVGVVVAARDLAAGARLVRGALAVRRVPARYVPPDALGSVGGLAGARVAVPVRAGTYLTASLFGASDGGRRGGGTLAAGERAVTVEVAAGGGPAASAGGGAGPAPGMQVDVLVSTDSGSGGGRTLVALAGAELLRLEPGPGGTYPDATDEAAPGAPTALATLRVSLRQAVYLTAADNFAREVRLLARPPGDRSTGGVAVFR
jgi:pilus assembly protein CpaB